MVTRRTAISGIAGIIGSAGPLHAWAQESDWPKKPLRIIVPSPAGASTDAMARLFADHLKPVLNQAVIVENRPGANQTIGIQTLVASPPDGYSVLLSTTEVVRAPLLYPNVKYDPFVDLAPLTQLAAANAYLAVPESLGVSTLGEFLKLAQRGTPVTLGNPGHGSAAHFYTVLMAQQSKADLSPVSYQGTLPMVPDMLGGRITAGWLSGDVVQSLEGKIKVLGVASVRERVPAFASVPTFREQGINGLDVPGFVGLFARGGTPTPILDRLEMELTRIKQLPDVAGLVRRTGFDPVGPKPRAEFLAQMRTSQEGWQHAIRTAGIKL